MKSRNDEKTERVLLLLKIDANNVFNRIKARKSEYLEIFALRRTREHFPMIFNNRYETTSIESLMTCSTELIATLDKFYTPVEEMKWYLYQTEDMPNTVEDFINRKISRMGKLLTTLNMYLDAELGIEPEEAPAVDKPLFIDQPEAFETQPEPFEDVFSTSLEDDTSQKS